MTLRSIWRRPAGVALAAFAAGALALTTAGAASAATAGGHGDFRPQVFTISVSTDNPDGTVNAFGPIRGRDGTDQQVSDSVDVFQFDRGSVTVRHKAETDNQPKIDFRSCTAFYTEDGRWKIIDGSGKYRDAEGFGHYHLTEFAVLKRLHDRHGDNTRDGGKHGRCDVKGDPKFFKVFVVATGLASNGHGHGHGHN